MKSPSRKRLKAIIYIRVSLEREEMYSPEQQLFACEQFAKAEGIDIIDVVQDLDESGRNFAKRKIAQIIERVENDEAQVVIVWKWNRFGRNNLKSQINLAALEEVGGQLRAATEDFDTSTSAGKFSRDQMLLIADFQGNLIGDGWKDAHSRRRRNDQPHHGRQQFGYMRCPDCERNPDFPRAYLRCKTCKGVPVHDPVRGPALAEVYRRYLARESIRSITKDMAKRGIRSIHGKEMTTSKWFQVMDTGFAAGLFRYRDPEDVIAIRAKKKKASNKPQYFQWVKGKHKPLITAEEWEQYKLRRRESTTQVIRESRAKHAYSSMVRCTRVDDSGNICGALMNAGIVKRASGFSCSRKKIGGFCKGLAVTTRTLDKHVTQWLKENATGKDAGRAAMLKAATEKKNNEEIASHKAEIAKLTAKQDKLLDLATEGIVSPEDYERKNQELAGKIELLQQRVAVLERKNKTAVIPPPKEFMDLLQLWPRMTEDEKRAALSKIVDRIEVHKTEGRAPNRIVIVPKWAASSEPEKDQAASSAGELGEAS